MSIAEIKLKIIELKNKLNLYCDSDYYDLCDEIEYYENLLERKLEDELINSMVLF